MSPLVAYDDDDDDEKTDVQDSGDGNNVPNVKSALNDETSYKRGRFRAPKTRKHHEQELATSVPQNFSKCKQVIAVELAAADDNSLSEESSMRDHKLADHEHVSLRSVLPPPKRAKIGPKPSLTDAHKSTKSTSPYLKSTHSDKPPDEESSTSASISAPRIQNAPLMPLRVSRKIKSRSAPMAEDELAEPLIPIPMAQPMKDFTAVSDSSDKLKLHDEGSYIPMIYNGESDGALAVDAYYAENFDSNAAELSGTSIEKQLPQHEMAIPDELLGRRSRDSAVKIVDYNAGEVYRENEEYRARAIPESQPIRSVAPGRHSLSSLVSMANLQKNEFEEHFARNRQTKRESSSKYGF